MKTRLRFGARNRPTKNFTTIEREHRQLEQRIQLEPFSGEQLDQVRTFMQETALVGLITGNSAQRDRLRAILRQWGTWVGDRTGKYPLITLEPWRGPGWLGRAWPWMRRLLVLLGIVGVVALAYYFGPRWYRLIFPSLTQSEVLIVVARFDEPSGSRVLEDIAGTVGLLGGEAVTGESLAAQTANRLTRTLGEQVDGLYVRRLRRVISDTVALSDLQWVPAAAPVTLVIGGVIGDNDSDGLPVVMPTLHLTSTVADKLALLRATGPLVRSLPVQTADLIPNSVTQEAAYAVGLFFLAEQRYPQAVTAFSIAVQEAQAQIGETPQLLPGLEKAYLGRAEAYRALQKWEEAIGDYTAVINLDRDRDSVAQAHLQRALVYTRQAKEGDRDRALEDLTAAIEQGVEDLATAYYRRGLIYLEQQNYQAAIADLDEAIALAYEPLSEVYFRRGLAYSKLGDSGQALADYDQAAQDEAFSRPDLLYFNRGVTYNQVGEYARAEDDLDAALEKSYSDAREAQYQLGVALASQGKHKEAAEAFAKVLEGDTTASHPRWADALYRRGLSYYALGSYDQAVNDFSTLLGKDESRTDARFQRALAFFNLARYQEAIADLDATLKQDPSRTAAYYWRGRAYMAAGRYEEAAQDLTVAIDQDERVAEARYYRGLAHFEREEYDVARDDLVETVARDAALGEQAIAYLTQVIARDPDDPAAGGAYYLRGEVYRALGGAENLLLARQDLTASLDLDWDTRNAEIYRARAQVNFELGEYQAAAQDWTTALEPERGYADAEDYYWRGRAHLALGKLEQAIQDFTFYLEGDVPQQQTLQPAPRQVEVYLLRGGAYLQLGAYEAASNDFETAIQLATTESDKAQAYTGLGEAQFHLGEYEQAQASLSTAIALDETQRQLALDYFGQIVAVQRQSPEAAPAYFMRAFLLNDGTSEGETAALSELGLSIQTDRVFVRSYLLRGQVYHAQAQYTLAITDYSQVIAIEPERAEAYFLRGQVYAQLGRHESAIADYTTALEANYAQPALVYHARGVSYYEQRAYDLALADLNAALSRDASLAESHLYRGLIYFQQAAYGQATESLAIAIRLDSDLGQEALSAFEGLIESSTEPAVQARAYYMRGRIHLLLADEDNLQLALDDLTAAIQNDPTLSEAYYWRGQVYFQQQDYSRAINDLDQALGQDATFTAAYYQRGLARFQLADYEGALRDLTVAIRFDPTRATQAIVYFGALVEAAPNDPATAPAYYIRGRLYQARGDSGDLSLALQDFTIAILRNPTFAPPYFDRGLLRVRLNTYAQAINDLSKAIELDYNVTQAYYRRGLAYAQQDNPENAIQDFTAALQRDPNLVDALFQRGQMYYRSDDYSRAIDDYGAYLVQVPNSAQVHFERGLAYASRGDEGDRQQAVDDFTAALRLESGWAEALLQRGLAYAALDDRPAAEADFSAALAADPTLSEALYRRGLIRLTDGLESQEPEVQQTRLLEAVGDFDQLIAMRAEFADAYYNRARAQRALGELRMALADFETYLELVPNAPDRLLVEKWIAELRQQLPLPAEDVPTTGG